MPKISIIMPVYNSAVYLKDAIDSILNQTFSDWEFIIINEFGSNDGSKEIVKQYASVDNRFVLIQNESKLGISESMNVGLKTATGEYIARMDADDISLPKRFEKQIEYMDKHSEIVMCGVKVEIFGSNTFEWKLETNPDKLATNILFYSPSVHPTIMIRKSFLDKYGIKYNKDYKASEDYDLFSQICRYGKVANMNEVLFRYRIMENNATFKKNDIGLLIYNEIMRLQFQRLQLSFNEDDLNLLSPHLCMKGAKGKEALIRLSQLDLLLKKILIANDKVKLYQIDPLMMTLNKRFKEAYNSISWACSGVDLKKADEIYYKSIFTKDYFYKPNYLNEIIPTVSVLLPTYNSQKYLMDTIWSILEQTYKDYELIILNEYGSNDDTIRIAEMFQDPRIKIIQNTEKKGLAESLNIGIREARGKYLARIDADDLCDKNRFKLQVQFLDNNLEYGVCGSWQHHFGINADWVHKCSMNHEEIVAELLYNCDLCHSTLMLRKEYFVKNNLFYDNHYAAEDYELWTRAINKFKFANIPQILGEYRVGEDNITSKKMEQLSQESGELAARNLEYYFGIKVPEYHILMLSGWRNEISRLEPKTRKFALKQEKKILYKIWEVNKTQKIFNDQSLLKTINKRWRSITNTWQEDNIIVDLNDLFKMYRYGTIKSKLSKSMPRQKLSAKKIIKKILSSIFRPIKYRTVDVIRQQIWDIDGHLGDLDGHVYDYKSEILDAIKEEQSKSQQYILQEITDVKNDIFNYINSEISINRQEIIKFVENEIIRSGELEVRILKAEKDILETVDSRVWKAEKNITQMLDGRIWKSENLVTEKLASRQHLYAKILSLSKDQKKIFLFGTPYHSNLGDHAQSYCINEWCKRNYPKHKVYEFRSVMDEKSNYYPFLIAIKEKMSPDDKIFIHSGSHLTDLFASEAVLTLALLRNFKNHPIVIFPQSIYYSDLSIMEDVAKVFNAHNNLFIMIRDVNSYQIAKRYFYHKNIYLYPDIAQILIGQRNICNSRNGILICKRDDIESLIDKNVMNDFIKKLEIKYGIVDMIDTDINVSCDVIETDRKYYIDKLINKFSQYKVIITDRMHGGIFSLIANTPVILLKAKEPKVETSIKWYDNLDEFKDYVFICNELSEVENIVDYIMPLSYNHKLPPYFAEKYYDKLPELLNKENYY